jgi:DNA-binding CsgD family transcriptional regulator
MPKQAIKLDLLEQIIAAPDLRQTAEAALAAFREVAPGDHFSAICYNSEERRAEVFFLDHGWLAAGNGFWQAAQQSLCAHPLARRFLARRQSMALVRSQEVPEAVWRQSAIYNEVDRPLGVADIATIYQPTASNHVLVLTCGRSGRFSDRDLAPIQSFQRILSALVPSCAGVAKTNVLTPALSGSIHSQSPLSRLTAREHEVQHWVREGKRDQEIGLILGVSPRTVHHHLENIYRKLGVETRTAAAFVR